MARAARHRVGLSEGEAAGGKGRAMGRGGRGPGRREDGNGVTRSCVQC